MNYQTVFVVTSVFLIGSLIKLNQAGFACLENPCAHGICIDDINSPHKCFCRDGFTGWSCEQNWDECRAVTGISPCLNGGVCFDGIASFNCSCPEPFAGKICEINLSQCDDIFPCKNNGSCTYSSQSPHETGLMCICPPGFTGSHCEEDVSMCNNVTCFNGGKCIDDVGKKFYCQCQVGWSGNFCQLSIDECASAPCLNGGVCVDKINDFSCACPFGYTGKACETKLDICEENPCKNGAFCLQESGKKVCYCVPDFHGPLCEEQYNECDPPTKCANGGTCIDGVGTFTCSCPPNFFGPTCLCSRNELEMSAECSDILVSSMTTEATTKSSSTSPAETRGDGGNTSLIPDTTSVHLGMSSQFIPLIPTASLAPTPSPSWTILMSSDSPYDPGGVSTLSSWRIVQVVDPTLSNSEYFLKSSSLYSYSVGRASPTHAMLDPTPFLVSSSLLITNYVEDTAAPIDRSETYDPCPTISVSMEDTETVEHSSIIHPSPTLSSLSLSIGDIMTSPFILTPTPTINIPSSSIFLVSSSLDSNELISEFPPAYLTSTLRTPLPSTSFDSSLWDIPDSDSYTVLYPPESQSLEMTTFIIPESTLPPPSSFPSPSLTTMVQNESASHLLTPTPSFESTTIIIKSSEELVQSSSDGILSVSTDLYSTPLPSSLLSTDSLSPSTAVFLTPIVTPTATLPPPVVRNETDPCGNYCRNGGRCVFTSIEPICQCPFKYVGTQCERIQEEVQMPSFSGESFLKYELQRTSADIIEISAQMATVVPDGILMYSTIGWIYALIYIQNGLVTLHFSCGAQSMHFVETRTRVDNGFNFTLSFRLENVIHGQNELRCIGQVSLNESYSMRGEQIVDRSAMSILEKPIKTVFLGGLDKPELYTTDDIIRILPGFRGCVYRLQVNEELLSMFQDARDGRDISECSTFGCVINPCVGQSRCVSSRKYPFWQCICPSGFEGIRCNLRTCGVNPCKNGAICTIHNNHTNEAVTGASSKMCLCPLGFHGDLCQARVNITKPSFHGTPDYSSFIAYDQIPRFADWMQLKFHFITRNMSQFSLLMYAGSDLANINVMRQHEEQQLEPPPVQEHDQYFPTTDFFALSFLQGFIALTWNLGSGTQRIITPSRIDNRIFVHTLFAGRQGRVAWLKVDGMRNTTGKTPGPLYRLNVNSDLFVGGHEIPRFEGLPLDIPFHSGFQGCIFDLGFRVKNKLFLPRALKARNVNNCYEEDC